MMDSLGTQIGQFIERHQMRARVIQSEKLASLGMLSAGVAHEINNPLAYVANNLAVLERDVRFLLTLLAIYEKAERRAWRPTQPELIRQVSRLAAEFDLTYVKENMGKILQSTRQGVKRVADIVQNLRGFARLDHAAVDQADIHEAIQTAVEMLRGRLDRRSITVEEHLGELAPGRRLARAAQPGLLEPAGQRHAGDRVDPSRRRPDRDHHRREQRRDRRRGGRQRLRDPRRDPAPDLRSVLHHQGGRRRHRIGALHHPQHGSGPRRPSGSRKRSRPGHALPRLPAGGQELETMPRGTRRRPRISWIGGFGSFQPSGSPSRSATSITAPNARVRRRV